MWTAKQFENDSVGGEHFIRFPDENAVFKFVGLSVHVAWNNLLVERIAIAIVNAI